MITRSYEFENRTFQHTQENIRLKYEQIFNKHKFFTISQKFADTSSNNTRTLLVFAAFNIVLTFQ